MSASKPRGEAWRFGWRHWRRLRLRRVLAWQERKRVEPSKLVEDVRGWLFRAPPRSPSTATGGDTTGTWVGRTPRRSTAAARIKWLVRGLDWEELFVEELGGGSKYRLFCLFCTSTYVNDECIWDELHKCPMYSIYIFIRFCFFGAWIEYDRTPSTMLVKSPLFCGEAAQRPS